jgi:poly(A) polymerase
MPEKGRKNPISEPLCSSRLVHVLLQAIRAGRGQPLDGTAPTLEPGDLETVPPGDVKALLDEILVTPQPDIAMIVLKVSNFLAIGLPEIDALTAFDDGSGEHKDLWDHTLRVLAQTPPRAVLRWAALLHDIGKVKTKTVNEKGEIHFIGHEAAGGRMAGRIMKRFAFPPDEASAIRFLIVNHLRCSQYDPGWTDSAVRRLSRELGDRFDDQVLLSRADITTARHKRRDRYLRLLDELAERARAIGEEDARPPLLPSGLGNDIMQAFGLAPGPEVGRLRKRLESLVTDGTLKAGEPPEYYVNYLKGLPNAVNNEPHRGPKEQEKKGSRKNKFPG